jgi:hypothetical protein
VLPDNGVLAQKSNRAEKQYFVFWGGYNAENRRNGERRLWFALVQLSRIRRRGLANVWPQSSAHIHK